MEHQSVSSVTRVSEGTYRVEADGRAHIVYVAGPPENLWAFWNGRVFRGVQTRRADRGRRSTRLDVAQSITAPMPATVRKILASPGSHVKKGDTLILLEAMKMELPLRAPADAVVTRVNCAEGDLVQPDAVLVELQ
jgi:biotin carboxyl carrier protein